MNHRTRRPLTGARAVATGAALYSAGFAAFKGRRFLRAQLAATSEDDQGGDELRDEQAPLSERPRRRAARKKGAPPSLDLPRQRWPRVPVGRE